MLLALFGVLAGCAWLWRALIVERLARLLIADAGIGAVTFELERVDLYGARIGRFAVPGLGIAGEAIEVAYDPREL
ncbi:MAG TPA: hypothetical protein VIR45_13460, partial [Kiloniellaceae bacterium]